jgi:hypothetical protein
MAILLAVVGFAWALIGLGNIALMLTSLDSGFAEMAWFGLAINVVWFVLPGVALGAIGLHLVRHRPADTVRVKPVV